ncbi:hypothetical protein [Mycobacterium botniense]|uniref:ESAT-6-like protein EsxC n=1 Tax=Mycobacterium botniense TaxID=84962 RepID=A0A7I9XVF0_9MYCO|nr:hypothetical protein [Mycobacterium botniense]GFG73726.1 hypothetical protein MBOT_10910 [Mycobacterium botniense]
MDQPIIYRYGNIADYQSHLGTASALLSDCQSDLAALNSALMESHHGDHAAAWQGLLQQVNASFQHFAEVVLTFGRTHAQVSEAAAHQDASLASGLSI